MDVVSPQASIHILQDLTPFRIYRVTVSAVNDVGQGQEAEATFETGETRAWMILFQVHRYYPFIAIFISCSSYRGCKQATLFRPRYILSGFHMG